MNVPTIPSHELKESSRNSLAVLARLTSVSKSPRVVLVDDDPLFLRSMAKVAKDSDIQITTCKSLSELAEIATTHLFDIAIVDYYLDGIKLDLRGTEIASILNDAPVILVSQNPEECTLESTEHLPDSVKNFVSKTEGPAAILGAALREWSYLRLRNLASAPQSL